MDEHDSDVDRELHRKILTLVQLDEAAELDQLLRSLCLKSEPKSEDTTELITPSTCFYKRARRNLLHLCTYLQARACVRLLIHPPYSWDPDQLDRVNRTPLHFAEARDDLATLYELVHLTREQRVQSWWPALRPEFGGQPSTCLFWPQDLLRWPMQLSALLNNRAKGITGCLNNLETQYVYKTPMIGPLLALVFELYMATPELFTFDLWTGCNVSERACPTAENRFWPIRVNDLSVDRTSEHLKQCTIYPHCLYQLSVHLQAQFRSAPNERLIAIRNRWLVHRLRGGGDDATEDGQDCLRPPTLKDLCRASFRRLLVLRRAPHTSLNYAQLVAQLHLPLVMHDQLLYREIWDCNDFEQYLIGGYGGNVPLGVPVDASRIKTNTGQSGVLIGHRFIPDPVQTGSESAFVL